ncbi:MAG: endopeptidase La [Phototrophicaceae bacterium]
MTDSNGELAFDTIPNAVPDAEGLITLTLVLVPQEIILPHTITPLPIDFDAPLNKNAVHDAIENQKTIIYVSQVNDFIASKSILEQIPQIATEVALLDITDTLDDMTFMMAQGRRRVELLEMLTEDPFYTVKARVIEEVNDSDIKFERLRDEALSLLNEIADLNDLLSDELIDYIHMLDDFSELADMLASILPLSLETRQEVLDELDIAKRLKFVISLLDNELRALEVQDDVNSQVQNEFNKMQREVYLREQMRVIQEELGESDISDADASTLRERLLKANLPEEAHKQALKEVSRLSVMSPMSPEAGIIRTYLDWMLDLPWHTASKDNLNLRHAEKVLNREHFGLEKIKERILEHIAVRKLAGADMKSPILCFVGPPGVGKTSLGKSIAEALGREFVRISLGGVRDEAEIRGHRRTYIGAMPGRFIQTIKRAGTVNPVFMLDEIDKMSEDYRGDPASALLEVLDPEQNNEFSDHYLEVPYDLSNVMFIATANELYPLPEALEDRMEIIEFRAYTEEEKLEIAKRFLIPKQLRAHGLFRRGISFLDSAILHIIQHYTLEAGVRNLEREIANICRKLTKLAALRQKYPKRITANLVEKYLGPQYILDSQVNKEDSIGLATGLVWTSGGGDIQMIEASLLPGKGNLTLTGSLGDVLQESAQIAWNYMRSLADKLDVSHDDFDTYDVHIHLPEGAVPKDGPSAGITLATTIISIFTECKVRSDWAMTGEMTLRGHVLPVGGIKDKVLGARRRGITNLILPADNEKDLVDIPKKALRDLNIQFVKHMSEVVDLVLMEAPDERQRDINRPDLVDDEQDEDN